MHTKKLRSLEEVEENLWRDPHDPSTWRHIDAPWRLGSRFRQRLMPGVKKFRSIEDANCARRAKPGGYHGER